MSDASAVDTDTELTKLIQLQSHYSANAQVLADVAQHALDTLMNGCEGVAGRRTSRTIFLHRPERILANQV